MNEHNLLFIHIVILILHLVKIFLTSLLCWQDPTQNPLALTIVNNVFFNGQGSRSVHQRPSSIVLVPFNCESSLELYFLPNLLYLIFKNKLYSLKK